MDLFASHPEILEVTLRDGSYLIDFQFTAEDTFVISSALESVGFRWIEVGHGVGLGAARAGKGGLDPRSGGLIVRACWPFIWLTVWPAEHLALAVR